MKKYYLDCWFLIELWFDCFDQRAGNLKKWYLCGNVNAVINLNNNKSSVTVWLIASIGHTYKTTSFNLPENMISDMPFRLICCFRKCLSCFRIKFSSHIVCFVNKRKPGFMTKLNFFPCFWYSWILLNFFFCRSFVFIWSKIYMPFCN